MPLLRLVTTSKQLACESNSSKGIVMIFAEYLRMLHAAFMRAYSEGIYYNEHIKDRYQC